MGFREILEKRNGMIKRKASEAVHTGDTVQVMAADIRKQCRTCRYWDRHIAGGCGGCLRILEKDHKLRAVDENGKCIRFERGKRIPNRGLYI